MCLRCVIVLTQTISQKVSITCQISTRLTQGLHVRGIASDTFSNKGTKDWNGLPDQIKSIVKYIRFKYECKRFLVKRATNAEF